MRVTAIITTFKRPVLLTRALRSVLTQPREGFDLEVIVSDDDPEGTAWPSVSPFLENSDDSKIIKYIRRESHLDGVAASRNRALEESSGEWVLFLDDDDELVDQAIQKLLSHALNSNADFCAGNYSIISEDRNQVAIRRVEKNPNWIRAEQLYLGNIFPIGSYLFRKQCITSHFYSHLRTHEDWLFLIENLVVPNPKPKVSRLNEEVLRIYHSVDESRSHRNFFGGRLQHALDYARVYSIHSIPSLAHQRTQILRRMSPSFHVDIDMMLSGSVDEKAVFPISTKQGKFLICNPLETIQSTLIKHDQFEPLASEIASVIAQIREGVIIDVGANQGAFSIPTALKNPTTKIICAEPQVMVFMQLCSNIFLNRITSALPKNVAVGPPAKIGRVIKVPKFNLFDARYTGSVTLDRAVAEIRGNIPGIAEPSKTACEFDDIEVLALDEIVGDMKVSFIKIDVEGMELDVLKSGENCLKNQAPCLFFESWSLEQFGKQREEILKYVSSLGYQVLQFGEDFFAFQPERISNSTIVSAFQNAGISIPQGQF